MSHLIEFICLIRVSNQHDDALAALGCLLLQVASLLSLVVSCNFSKEKLDSR